MQLQYKIYLAALEALHTMHPRIEIPYQIVHLLPIHSITSRVSWVAHALVQSVLHLSPLTTRQDIYREPYPSYLILDFRSYAPHRRLVREQFSKYT